MSRTGRRISGDLLAYLNMLLLMWVVIVGGGLAVNFIRKHIWVPVTAEVIWSGDKCEIQSNSLNASQSSSYWFTHYLVNCEDAQRTLSDDNYIKSNQRFSWRSLHVPYVSFTFESDGNTHTLLRPEAEMGGVPYSVGNRFQLYHRKNDYEAIMLPLSGYEIIKQLALLCLALTCFSTIAWVSYNYFVSEFAAEIEREKR